MSALLTMISAHPITSIWLTLTVCVWAFVYASTKPQDSPPQG